jgi:tRNA(Ile2) C34 agmatinyltransferase TiaS
MTLEDFRKLHPTAVPEVLEALYDDRLVAFDEDVTDEEVIADMAEVCPLCGGPQQILGKLGQRVHLRCRDCGADTNNVS